MFEKAIALNKQQHGELRYTARPGDYGFAAQAQFIPVVGSEAAKVAETLPIVFPPEGGGAMPLAMVGVRPGQNAFVGPEGQWLGSYVPVQVQRYPFNLAELPAQANASEANRSYAICVVPGAPHFTEGGDQGVALLDDEGKPTALTRSMQTELAKVQADAERTQFMVRQLEEAGLLLAVPIPVVTAPGEAIAVKGARILHIDKFRTLNAEQKKALEPSGALALAQVHIHSLKNLAGGRLGEAAAALAPAVKAAQAAAGGGLRLKEGANALLAQAATGKAASAPLPQGAFSNFLKSTGSGEPKA
ncbi:MAG: hypothetical protein EOO29_00760 [Comamonadaceae bacterium]|nr:MAG: hypothetical protein EOO29_00760 [Comamonadaceae bacterium]